VFVGLLVDRRPLAWLAGAGVALAGVGAGLSGLAPAYAMTWVLLLLSGVGVAMFHPAAGAGARVAAGESASAMSVFATGGSIGFFLAPRWSRRCWPVGGSAPPWSSSRPP
jgi:FSR family fosmidomycin resistance protein-like MFS transporter